VFVFFLLCRSPYSNRLALPTVCSRQPQAVLFPPVPPPPFPLTRPNAVFFRRGFLQNGFTIALVSLPRRLPSIFLVSGPSPLLLCSFDTLLRDLRFSRLVCHLFEFLPPKAPPRASLGWKKGLAFGEDGFTTDASGLYTLLFFSLSLALRSRSGFNRCTSFTGAFCRPGLALFFEPLSTFCPTFPSISNSPSFGCRRDALLLAEPHLTFACSFRRVPLPTLAIQGQNLPDPPEAPRSVF